jgi:hypothetical protein
MEGKGAVALSGKVRDSPVPFPWIMDLREPRSPNRARAARINCRQRRPSPMSGPHHAKTVRRTHTRDHYDMATEEPRRPVTSAPTSPTTRVVVSPEKVCPRRATTAATVGI